jgi:hypothetical protein
LRPQAADIAIGGGIQVKLGREGGAGSRSGTDDIVL